MLNELIKMRTSLSNYESFRDFYLNVISIPDPRLVQINAITAYWLKHKQLGQIENWSESSAHSLTEEQLDEGAQYISDQALPLDYYIYPASRSAFYKEFFKFSPMLSSALYDAMAQQNLILGVGAGRGYATLFKYPVSLDQDFYNQFIGAYLPTIYKQAVSDLSITRKPSSLVSALNYASLTEDEIKYLFVVIGSYEMKVQELEKQIADLNNKYYINSQLTWR